MANDLALRMGDDGVAQMSCIAGVGGDVPSLVKLATSGRDIIAIDGCPLACARSCLARHSVTPNHHVVLSDLDVRKRAGAYDPAQFETVLAGIVEQLRLVPTGATQ